MMKITGCPICEKDFMHDKMDYHLRVNLNNTDGYSIQDDIWPSRRWNEDKTDYIDLSGEITICQECYEKKTYKK